MWRWYRRVELYRNPNNLSQLLAGHLVNFALGDSMMLRIAAQCLLISTRILECAQQQTILYDSWLKWKESIQGNYPRPNRCPWSNIQSKILASPSTAGRIENQCRAIWNYAHRVAMRTADVVVEFFKLSMHVMDAMDTFCLSPHTQNEGINEFAINAIKWMDKLVDNKEELLAGIQKNRPLIERILLNSPITYTQLHTCVANTLEKTETVHRNAKTIVNFSNGALVHLGKRALTGAMIVVGLPTKYLPASLVLNA